MSDPGLGSRTIAVAFGALLACSRAFAAPPSEPATTWDETFAGLTSLAGPVDRVVRTLTFEDGAVLQTNGHPVHFRILGSLRVKGMASIRAWPGHGNAVAPPAAAAGNAGTGFNPGPNANSTARAGGEGSAGSDGAPGIAGRRTGTVWIQVFGTASGDLRLDLSGEPGGAGGAGGRGGDGGAGEQGRGWSRGRDCVRVLWWDVACWDTCNGMPGGGGPGGPGGHGGRGGAGGDGGAGGFASIWVADRPSTLRVVHSDLQGGAAGPPGVPGLGGRGGSGGCGGRTHLLCDGLFPRCRCGPHGADGAGGGRAPFGAEGPVGDLALRHVESVVRWPDGIACKGLEPVYQAEPEGEWDALRTLWAVLGRHAFGTDAQPVDQTKDSKRSYVFLAPAPFTDQALKLVHSYVAGQVARGCPAACPDALTVAAVLQKASGRTKLEKQLFMLDAAVLELLEVAANTKRIRIVDMNAGVLEGGSVYYAWPVEDADPASRLLTRVDDDLFARLARIHALVVPELLNVFDVHNQRVDSLLCEDHVVLPVFFDELATASPATRFTLPLAGRPPGAPPHVALSVDHRRGQTVFAAAATANLLPQLTFAASCDYFRALEREQDPFSCFSGSSMREAVRALGPALAYPSVMRTLILLQYLRGSWEAARLSELVRSAGSIPNHDGPCEGRHGICTNLRD